MNQNKNPNNPQGNEDDNEIKNEDELEDEFDKLGKQIEDQWLTERRKKLKEIHKSKFKREDFVKREVYDNLYATDHIQKIWFKKQLGNDTKFKKPVFFRKSAPVTEANASILGSIKKREKEFEKSALFASAMHTIYNTKFRYKDNDVNGVSINISKDRHNFNDKMLDYNSISEVYPKEWNKAMNLNSINKKREMLNARTNGYHQKIHDTPYEMKLTNNATYQSFKQKNPLHKLNMSTNTNNNISTNTTSNRYDYNKNNQRYQPYDSLYEESEEHMVSHDAKNTPNSLSQTDNLNQYNNINSIDEEKQFKQHQFNSFIERMPYNKNLDKDRLINMSSGASDRIFSESPSIDMNMQNGYVLTGELPIIEPTREKQRRLSIKPNNRNTVHTDNNYHDIILNLMTSEDTSNEKLTFSKESLIKSSNISEYKDSEIYHNYQRKLEEMNRKVYSNLSISEKDSNFSKSQIKSNSSRMDTITSQMIQKSEIQRTEWSENHTKQTKNYDSPNPKSVMNPSVNFSYRFKKRETNMTSNTHLTNKNTSNKKKSSYHKNYESQLLGSDYYDDNQSEQSTDSRLFDVPDIHISASDLHEMFKKKVTEVSEQDTKVYHFKQNKVDKMDVDGQKKLNDTWYEQAEETIRQQRNRKVYEMDGKQVSFKQVKSLEFNALPIDEFNYRPIRPNKYEI